MMKHFKIIAISSLTLLSSIALAEPMIEPATIDAMTEIAFPNDDLDTCWVAPEWRD